MEALRDVRKQNHANIVDGERMVNAPPNIGDLMTYPDWNKMTDQQKFEFLHQWCGNLSNAVQSLQGVTQQLHERLRAVEAKVVETA
jgi:hypothetical protein